MKKFLSDDSSGQTENQFYRATLRRITNSLLQRQVKAVAILDGLGIEINSRDSVSIILADTALNIDTLNEIFDSCKPDKIIFIRRPTAASKRAILKLAEERELPFVTLALPEIEYAPTSATDGDGDPDIPTDMIQFESFLQSPLVRKIAKVAMRTTLRILDELLMEIIKDSACRFFFNMVGM